MPLVKVVNKNKMTFSQRFRDKDIVIAPHKYIEMESDEATLFLGEFYPPEYNSDGQQLESSYKKLVIVKGGDVLVEEQFDEHTCQACGYSASNEKDLNLHITSNHLEELAPANEELDKKLGRPVRKVSHDARRTRNSSKTKV